MQDPSEQKDPFGFELYPEQTSLLSPQPDFLSHDPFTFSDISSFSSSGSSSAESIPSPNQQADLSFQSFSSDLDGFPSEDELFELMCGVQTVAPSSSDEIISDPSALSSAISELTPQFYSEDVFQPFHLNSLESLWNGADLGISGSYPSPLPSHSVKQANSSCSSSSSPLLSSISLSSSSPSPPSLPPSSTTSKHVDSISSTTRLDHTTLAPSSSPKTLARSQSSSILFESMVPQSQEVPSFILSYLSHSQEQAIQIDPQSCSQTTSPSLLACDLPSSSLSAGAAEKRKAPPSPPALHSSIPEAYPSVQSLPASAPATALVPTFSSARSSPSSITGPQPDQEVSTDGPPGLIKHPTDHNAIERKYRDNINDGFTRLRDSVPVLRALFKTSTPLTLPLDTPSVQTGLIDGMPPETKQGKATVLGAAREYILELQRERARLKRYSQFLEKRLGSSAWQEFLAADSQAVLDPYLQSITTPTRPSAALPVRSQPVSSSALTRSLPPPPPPPRKKARVTAAVKPRRAAPHPTTITTTTAATAATAGAVGGGTVMLVLGLGVGLFNPFDPSYSVDKNPGAGVVKGKVILGTQATPSSSLQSTPPPLSFAAPTCLCISIVVLLLMLLVVSRSARRRFQRGVSRWTKLVVRGSGSGMPGEDDEIEGKQDQLPVGWVELEGGQVGGWVGWGWKAGEKESHEWIGCGDREYVLPKPIILSTSNHTTSNHIQGPNFALAHLHAPTHPNINQYYPARPLPVPLPDPRVSSLPIPPTAPLFSSLTPVAMPGSISDHENRHLSIRPSEPGLSSS